MIPKEDKVGYAAIDTKLQPWTIHEDEDRMLLARCPFVLSSGSSSTKEVTEEM